MPRADYKPKLALDAFIVLVAASLIILSTRLGLRAGEPAVRGPGAILGGIYLVYLGLLFLLSYMFPGASYVFSFMRYISEECSRPRGRYMALLYCALALVFGGWLLLIGLGVF